MGMSVEAKGRYPVHNVATQRVGDKSQTRMDVLRLCEGFFEGFLDVLVVFPKGLLRLILALDFHLCFSSLRYVLLLYNRVLTDVLPPPFP